MKPNTLSHEETSEYLAAFQLYRVVLEVAQSEMQFVNARLETQAHRVLQHAAAAGRSSPRARARWIEYARMAMARLAASVDAGWAAGCLSREERERVRVELLQLEAEFSGVKPAPQAEPDPAADEDKSSTMPGLLPDSQFRVEELAELRRVPECEASPSCSMDQRFASLREVGLGPGG